MACALTLPAVAVDRQQRQTKTGQQMIATILRAWLGDAAFRRGNLNNHIGVTLDLAAPSQGRIGGAPGRAWSDRMKPPGEIAELARSPRRHGARQQRAARAPGVHGEHRGGGARERQRDRGVRHRAWRCSLTTTTTRRLARRRPRPPDLRARGTPQAFSRRADVNAKRVGNDHWARDAEHAGRRATLAAARRAGTT